MPDTPTLTGPGKHIERDRWGRPLITPPEGGKPEPYTRCTTYVGSLDDKENLMKWKQRMTAIGLAERPDLLLKVKGALDNNQALNKITDEAADQAGASRAATVGTELHAFTERIDRGETIPDLGDYQADIDAYRQATAAAGLAVVEIETFCVNDALKIGGTFDRIYEVGGQRYIGDLKTGSIDWGAGKFAMQLAVYANSQRYDHDTGKRSPLGVSQDRAILIHLPAGKGECTLYWLDIATGWASVSLAGEVREWRKHKRDKWMWPLAPEPQELPDPATQLLEVIAKAPTVQTLEAAYWLHQESWTDVHTQAAAARKAELNKTSTH